MQGPIPIGEPIASPELDAMMQEREGRFRKELEHLLNSHSRENGSDTPDFILAQFLADSLAAWDRSVSRRSQWYGGNKRHTISGSDAADDGDL